MRLTVLLQPLRKLPRGNYYKGTCYLISFCFVNPGVCENPGFYILSFFNQYCTVFIINHYKDDEMCLVIINL